MDVAQIVRAGHEEADPSASPRPTDRCERWWGRSWAMTPCRGGLARPQAVENT